jgi:ABC-2 type transport system ATP-binding protein
VFLTTQYLEEANELCDRLAILQDGRITHTGSPDELKSAIGTETVTLTLQDPSEANQRRAVDTVRRLSSLNAVAIDRTDDGLIIEADNARSATSNLFTELAAANITITDFDIKSPTLDDVFLTLAGEGDILANGVATDTVGAQEVSR